jgi:hypothetical protein
MDVIEMEERNEGNLSQHSYERGCVIPKKVHPEGFFWI